MYREMIQSRYKAQSSEGSRCRDCPNRSRHLEQRERANRRPRETCKKERVLLHLTAAVHPNSHYELHWPAAQPFCRWSKIHRTHFPELAVVSHMGEPPPISQCGP